jgi:RING finger protein 121
VYSWFLGVYVVSRAVGIAGYVLLILDMFGVGLLLSWLLPPGTSLLLLWYGLYFGILGRDCAEVASDQMASVMGSGSRLTSTVHNCGICGGELKDYTHLGEEVGARGLGVVCVVWAGSCRNSMLQTCAWLPQGGSDDGGAYTG